MHIDEDANKPTLTSWKPIEDLPQWHTLANLELPALAKVWQDQRADVEATPAFATFMERLVRRIAIETGVLERLYSIDEGITVLLIEHGIREALIPFGKTDQPASKVVQIILDQQTAVEALFDFVKRARTLSTSYIKELHQLLTAHQPTADAQLPDGRIVQVELLRGEWRKDKSVAIDTPTQNYCPPEHIGSEMDNLVSIHLRHQSEGVAPEVEAAWLHHRFTQIHPFQDGNGRVARCLASLVLIQARWFPLSIADQSRDTYIDSLRRADAGDLQALVTLFAEAEKREFVQSLTLLSQVAAEGRATKAIVAAVADRLTRQKRELNEQRSRKVAGYAERLLVLARERFDSTKREIENGLREVAHVKAWIDEAGNDDDNRTFYSYQIIEAAKKLSYFANRHDFSSWIRLHIVVERDTEILISFHVPGYSFNGILVGTALIFRKEMGESGPVTVDLETLSGSPFYFYYSDDWSELKIRFDSWLETIVQEALVYWQGAP